MADNEEVKDDRMFKLNPYFKNLKFDWKQVLLGIGMFIVTIIIGSVVSKFIGWDVNPFYVGFISIMITLSCFNYVMKFINKEEHDTDTRAPLGASNED
jgi:uncharacterized membrane protein YfcA